MIDLIVKIKLMLLIFIKSKQIVFWCLLFPLIMATLLGSMYQNIYVEEVYEDDVYTYAYVLEDDSEYAQIVDSLSNEDHFDFNQYDSVTAAKQAYEDDNLTGYVIFADEITVYDSSNIPILELYLDVYDSEIKKMFYQMEDSINVIETDNIKKAGAMDLLFNGMMFFTIVQTAISFIYINVLFGEMELYRTRFIKKETTDFWSQLIVSIITAGIAFLVIFLVGKFVFNVNSTVTIDYSNLLLLVVSVVVFLNLLIRIIFELLPDKIAMNFTSYFTTLLGFASGVYMLDLRLTNWYEFLLPYNPLALVVNYFDEKYYDIASSNMRFGIELVDIGYSLVVWFIVLMVIKLVKRLRYVFISK